MDVIKLWMVLIWFPSNPKSFLCPLTFDEILDVYIGVMVFTFHAIVCHGVCSGVTKGPADPAVRGGAILGGRQIVV